MKRALIIAALSLSASAWGADPAIPSNWGDFNRSTLPADVAVVTRVMKMQWWDVCGAWGRAARSDKEPRLKAALLQRLLAGNYINGVDLNNVTDRKPEIGMTTCGVFAMLGKPDQINNTQTARGLHSQMVYRSRRIYVYTDGTDGNGLVRSVQF